MPPFEAGVSAAVALPVVRFWTGVGEAWLEDGSMDGWTGSATDWTGAVA